MGAVVRIELHEVTITDGNSTASSALSSDFDIDNTIVLVANSKDVDTASDNFTHYFQEVTLTSGPNTINLDRGAGSTDDLRVKIWAIEFDPDVVSVQTGSIDLTTTSTVSNTGSVTAVDQNKAWIFYSWAASAAGTDDHGDYLCRAEFTSDTVITISRDTGANEATIAGTYYVAEYTGADASLGWDVQAASFTVLDDQSSGTGTISAVTEDKTLLIGSYRGLYQDDNPNAQTFRTDLTNSTTITCVRQSGTLGIGDSNFEVYAIEWNSGEVGIDVQRGIESFPNDTTTLTTTASITAVDQNISTVMPVVAQYGARAGGGAGASTPAGMVHTVFNSDTEILITRGTPSGAVDTQASWEVVTWGVAAVVSARRVFVVE